MSDAISSVLSQIRSHRMALGGGVGDVAGAGSAIGPLDPNAGGVGAAKGPAGGFGGVLDKALDSVSRAQANSSSLQQAFELGDPRADLARVMVAMQQSQVAFKATVEVRNRLVQAYQDVMNMPV